MYTHDTRACTKWELLITVDFEANICLNNVPWTTTKMKPNFRTNRRANITGLYLESRTSRRSVEVFGVSGAAAGGRREDDFSRTAEVGSAKVWC